MQVTILGTSSMVPTKDRNQSSSFISFKNEGILVDAGEGTQRQFKIKGIPLTKITKILITHWHGDHVFGLPGVISSLGAMEYRKKLEIYGPKGTKKRFASMFDAFDFDRKVELEIIEVESGIFLDSKEFTLECRPLEHGVPCLGYAFTQKDVRHIDIKKTKKLGIPEGPQMGKLANNKSITHNKKKITPSEVTYLEKGKKVTIISDSLYCNNAIKLAKDADLLVCEATYHSDLQHKAKSYMHMSGKDAAMIANQAGAKQLVVTHFSARYKNPHEIEQDARNVFDNSLAAKDFMVIDL